MTLVGPTGDLFFFVEKLLELRIRFLEQRCSLNRVLFAGLARSLGGHHATGTRSSRSAGGLADSHCRFLGDLVLAQRLVREDISLVDPHLDTDAAAGGAGLAEAVVNIGAQRMQRHAALAVPLGSAHLGAT